MADEESGRAISLPLSLPGAGLDFELDALEFAAGRDDETSESRLPLSLPLLLQGEKPPSRPDQKQTQHLIGLHRDAQQLAVVAVEDAEIEIDQQAGADVKKLNRSIVARTKSLALRCRRGGAGIGP